ncbi:MAG: N-acetyltransferase [Armatimonadetes bacterium]|nr:N-acetyltransferase [Armatimonadota bacterium]
MPTTRPAGPRDAESIARIYNQGIEDRIATFETDPRSSADILTWFERKMPIIVVEDGNEITAFASTSPYSERCAYAGVVEFSVYVAREYRGEGLGKLAMQALVDACHQAGYHKLTSRILAENTASLKLMDSLSFDRVGLLRYHGKVDGVWKDCVNVEYVIKANL